MEVQRASRVGRAKKKGGWDGPGFSFQPDDDETRDIAGGEAPLR